MVQKAKAKNSNARRGGLTEQEFMIERRKRGGTLLVAKRRGDLSRELGEGNGVSLVDCGGNART